MDTNEIFEKIKDMVTNGNLDEAKTLIEEHQDDLGPMLEQAKELLSNADGAEGLLDKVKGIFGK
jgi:hypothetical protein